MTREKWIAGMLEIPVSKTMLDDLTRIASEHGKSIERVARQSLARYMKRHDRKKE